VGCPTKSSYVNRGKWKKKRKVKHFLNECSYGLLRLQFFNDGYGKFLWACLRRDFADRLFAREGEGGHDPVGPAG
jgi:hypothetical protein